jgi:methionyl-tRNA formyltransferase
VNVLLVAEEAAGVRMLRALKARDDRVVAVMASPARQTLIGTPVWAVAETLGYPRWDAKFVKDPAFVDAIRAHEVDIILNVHSLAVIHPALLRAARFGGYNLHPGPLPRYAGLNVVNWALYRGEPSHGVTIHRMEAAIDAGPIAFQESFPIEPDDTALTVGARCATIGVRLMLRLLETVSSDPSLVPSHRQDLSQREYFGREVPRHGQLTWAQPAARAVDFVRACDWYPLSSPWGHPRARSSEGDIGIVKASRTGVATNAPPGTIGDIVGTSAWIACDDEWISVAKVHVDERFADAADVLQSEPRLHDGRA